MPQPSNASYGALAGTAVGTFGGPAGMAIGGMAGGMIGGMFDKTAGPDFSQAAQLYTLRRREIGDFANQLASARSSYLGSLNNMYNQAYTRFTNNAEPMFAARGLQVNGGAFAAELARKSSDYQAQLEPLAFEAERQDINKVNDAYAQAAGMNASMVAGGPGMQYSANRENSNAMGGFLGQLAGYGMRSGGFGGGDKSSPFGMGGQQFNNYGGGSGGWDFSPSMGNYRTGTVSNGHLLWD